MGTLATRMSALSVPRTPDCPGHYIHTISTSFEGTVYKNHSCHSWWLLVLKGLSWYRPCVFRVCFQYCPVFVWRMVLPVRVRQTAEIVLMQHLFVLIFSAHSFLISCFFEAHPCVASAWYGWSDDRIMFWCALQPFSENMNSVSVWAPVLKTPQTHVTE